MNKKHLIITSFLVLFLVATGVTAYLLIPGQTMLALTRPAMPDFPVIDTSKLSDHQKKLVATLHTEYLAQPIGTKYSEGAQESWCADFVSWVMREVGVPLANPNSGSWRIPGTHTLREYYEQKSEFHAIDSGYVPKLGDVAIYDGPGWFGQHTNIVLKYGEGSVTTIGGNEAGKIRVQTRPTPVQGLLGYGVSAL